VKFHIHMLLSCRIYPKPDSDCDHFACKFLVWVFFLLWGVVSVCYIHLGGLEKCYIVLHRVGGGPKIQFLRYIKCE